MKKTTNGWCGKILNINLSTKSFDIIKPQKELYHKFIGGRGLAGYYLQPHISKACDDPTMPILFFTGPLVNTRSPTSGIMTIMSRSPLTGTIGDTSCGGSFGSFLKKAGFDGLIITGKSDSWCGIEINNDNVCFTDAKKFIGYKTSKLHYQLKKKGSTATIGRAAHSGVMYSSIVIDGHYLAGRNGLGLLFSTKNLKYITVKGNKKTNIHNEKKFNQALNSLDRLTSASPALMGELGISNYGTGAIYDLTSARRMMPTDNFKRTYFEKSSSMNAASYIEKYKPNKTGCLGCQILCKKITKSGTVMPEFETMSHFSALIKNDSIETVTTANEICTDMGMDTVSAGSTLACYAEITDKTLNSDEIISLLSMIGNGELVGKDLGKGAFLYAQTKEKPSCAMTVKRMELPAYDPRGAKGMALAYATSTIGGCHLRAYPIGHEILRKPVATDRFTFSGKARIVKIDEDLNAVIDSLTACKFIFFGVSLEEYAELFSAVTGVSSTAQDLLKIGERICYNERMMNAKNSFGRIDDDLPARFFEESGSSGNQIEILPLNRNEFKDTLAKYYKARGLQTDGTPIKEKCLELGLEWSLDG